MLTARRVEDVCRLDDEQLVAAFRAGYEEAFGAIYDRYREPLLVYARQMLRGGRAHAEDALQDVFVRAHRALLTDERPMALRAWLYRVTYNRCIDELRRPALSTSLPASQWRNPAEEVERRMRFHQLLAEVHRLPDRQREALVLREFEGRSHVELGASLGVTVSAVKSLLVRARTSLAQALDAGEAPALRHEGSTPVG